MVQQEIANMPLNGRDFTELALYVPGVNMGIAGGAGSFAAINGARQDNTNFVVDGVDDRNVRGAAAQLRPNIDALQEFKMEVGGYSAEYGKMAGGILNMTLKSGSNTYHGTLFEYFRNDFFDSKAYFDTARLPFHQNQWGGVIQGPLNIPKVYNGHDRTFFMFSWESQRNPYSSVQLGNVPTALEDQGNFSGDVSNTGKLLTIKNPFSTPVNAPFPGNIIPASMFSPVAQTIMTFYPLPNRTAVGNNYISTAPIITTTSTASSPAATIGSTTKTAFPFATASASPGPTSLTRKAIWACSMLRPVTTGSLGGLNFTHVFSPTLLTEFHFGLARTANYDTLLGTWPTAAQIGMVGSTPGLAGFPAAFPTINVTGYVAMGYPNNEPINFYVTNYSFGQKFTWVKGTHILKWGTDIARNRFNQPYFNNSRGTMTASGIWSGCGHGHQWRRHRRPGTGTSRQFQHHHADSGQLYAQPEQRVLHRRLEDSPRPDLEPGAAV